VFALGTADGDFLLPWVLGPPGGSFVEQGASNDARTHAEAVARGKGRHVRRPWRTACGGRGEKCLVLGVFRYFKLLKIYKISRHIESLIAYIKALNIGKK
jgi:hypothetical protein